MQLHEPYDGSHHHITFNCRYDVVFCPKYRRKVLVNGVDTRLKELLNTKARELQTDIIELEVMPDHVHLLIECDPQVVKQLKGYTSHVLLDEFPSLKRCLPSLWTNAYLVATVGAVQLDGVERYIEDQKGNNHVEGIGLRPANEGLEGFIHLFRDVLQPVRMDGGERRGRGVPCRKPVRWGHAGQTFTELLIGLLALSQ